jgi:tetratricopeptide (TPR) repeat protein
VLAIDAVGQGDDDGALDALESLPNRGIATLTRPLLEAWVTLNRDGLEAAEAELLPLADQQGFTALYQLHRALLNDVAGRPERAGEAYDFALGAVSESSLRLTSLAGNFFERQGDIERARALYDDFALRNPDSLMLEQEHARLASGGPAEAIVADYRQGMAAALFDFASLLLQERIEEMAMVYSHLALRLDPNLLLARVLVGEMLQEQERHTAAIEAYRQIPTDSPLAFSAQLRMAEELDALEQTDAAISLLRETAEAWPERFEPHYRIGNVLRAQERFSEAADAYDLAMARLDEPGARHWTLFYFRGISRERSQDWDRAEEDFLRALDLEPEQPYVMNYLAYSWVEQKRNLTEAERMLKRAVELRPDDGYIVDSLGWVYYRLERYPEAVVELEKAVALRPSDPVINDHLGDAYWRTGRGREAQVQWRRALSLEPEEEDEKKILEKLEGGLKPDPEDI